MSHYHSATTASAATPTPGNGKLKCSLVSIIVNYMANYWQLWPTILHTVANYVFQEAHPTSSW